MVAILEHDEEQDTDNWRFYEKLDMVSVKKANEDTTIGAISVNSGNKIVEYTTEEATALHNFNQESITVGNPEKSNEEGIDYTVTVSANRAMKSYINGSTYYGYWYALLFDLNATPFVEGLENDSLIRKIDSIGYEIGEEDYTDALRHGAKNDSTFVVWLDANECLCEDEECDDVSFSKVITFVNEEDQNNTLTIKIVVEENIPKMNVSASLAEIKSDAIADTSVANSTYATLNFEANRYYVDNMNSIEIKSAKYEDYAYLFGKAYAIEVYANEPLREYSLYGQERLYSYDEDELTVSEPDYVFGKYYALLIDLKTDISNVEIVDTDTLLYEPYKSLGDSSTKLLVWVDGSKNNYLTIVEKATGYETYIYIETLDVEYVLATDNGTEIGTTLSNPEITKAFDFDGKELPVNDNIKLNDEKTYFVVRENVNKFVVTDGEDEYTYKKIEMNYEEPLNYTEEVWVCAKTLKLVSAVNPTLDEEDPLKANSEAISVTKDNNTVYVNVNSDLSEVTPISDDEELTYDEDEWYTFDVDLGTSTWLYVLNSIDQENLIVNYPDLDSTVFTISVRKSLTDSEDGYTIKFFNYILYLNELEEDNTFVPEDALTITVKSVKGAALVNNTIPFVSFTDALAYTETLDNASIKLLDDVDLNTSILKITKELSLDLNNKTLTAKKVIVDGGDLTIKDTSEDKNGKYITTNAENSGTALAIMNEGTLNLLSGTIKNTYGYGVYADEGYVNISGGLIDSCSASIASNGTTGNIYATITGGTLTAKNGPSMYIPTQKELTITGGTFNGGLGVRQGTVTITGGTFNATNNSIDSYAEYYNYSGNAWLGDALYAFGGTYESNDPELTNELVINISGGKFVSNNDSGTALAILDLGKIEQSITLNISGGTFTTTTEGRNAIEVLSLSDINVTDTNYGTYSGNVEVSITKGTFSTSIDEDFIPDGYEITNSNDVYVVDAISE